MRRSIVDMKILNPSVRRRPAWRTLEEKLSFYRSQGLLILGLIVILEAIAAAIKTRIENGAWIVSPWIFAFGTLVGLIVIMFSKSSKSK